MKMSDHFPQSENNGVIAHSRPLQWFIIVSGYLYGTGFLIVFTYYSRLGLKDLSPFFKLKYIYVGIIYSLLVIICTLPFLVYHYMKINLKKADNYEERKESIKIYLRSSKFALAILFLWSIIFYIFAFFAPHGLLGEHPLLIFLHIFPIIGLTLVRFCLRGLVKIKFISEDKIDEYEYPCRIYLFLGLVILFIADILYGFPQLFKNIFSMIILDYYIPRGINFFLVILIFSFYLYRIYRYYETYEEQWRKKSILATGICFLFINYIFSILTFAIFIYPYIPVEKGGSDFTYSPSTYIILKAESAQCFPELIDSTHPSQIILKKLKVIEQTLEYIYVADEKDRGGPQEWRKMMPKTMPNIIAINSKDVLQVKYLHN